MTLPVKHYLRPNYRLVLAGARRGRRPKYNWASVDWTQRTAVIAARLGASPTYVSNTRRRLGKPAPTRWSDTLDWHQTDSDLARQVGISRERIRQVRAELGKRPTPTPLELTVRDVHALGTESMTIGEAARETGHAQETVKEALKLLGRRPGRGRNTPGVPRPTERKYDWDAVDWANKTVGQIARELGCAPAVVTQARKRLGKPRGPDGRKVARKHKGEA